MRGSNIVPEGSLPELSQAVKETRKELTAVAGQLEEEKSKVETLKRRATAGQPVEPAEVQRTAKAVAGLEEKKSGLMHELMSRRAELEKTAVQLACGGAAGAIARTTVAPIGSFPVPACLPLPPKLTRKKDRVKVLMQTAHVQKTSHLYNSMYGTAAYVVKNEGPLALWRGNLTNCVRVMPHTATQFVTYDKIKVYMCGRSDGKLSVPQRLLAGSLSGIAAATVTQPLDTLRIRLQTDPAVNGKVRDAVQAMMSEGGIRAFYKGWTPAMLSLGPFVAVNFAAFDTLKTWWWGAREFTKAELKARNPLVSLSLGALAGIFAQTVCYPLDTVRRRMQLKGRVYPNTAMAFVTIARDEGVKGFYRGITANALKIMPNNALRFGIYETLTAWFVHD